MRFISQLSLCITILAFGVFQQVAAQSTRKHFINLKEMDTTVRPGDNFCEYAAGTRIKKRTENNKSDFGVFTKIKSSNDKKLHILLDSLLVTNPVNGSNLQKVIDFYRAGMDSAAIEKAGLEPLKVELSRIEGITNMTGLFAEIALEHTEGNQPLFTLAIMPELNNVDKAILSFRQGGLGLPGRAYYFETDANTVKIRKAYKAYIAQTLVMMGDDEKSSRRSANRIFRLERTLAGASTGKWQRANRTIWAVSDLDKLVPGIDWQSLLANLKIVRQDSVEVGMQWFFTEIERQMRMTTMGTWKKYLQFHLVNDMAPYMSAAFDTTHFNFYGRTLHGRQKQASRWERVIAALDQSEGDLIAQLFADKYFTAETKNRTLELINNLKHAYAERIVKIDWLSEATKRKCIKKLNALEVMVGYPEKWNDYSELRVVNNGYATDIKVARVWAYHYNMSLLDRPIDRNRWDISPLTVNAEYIRCVNKVIVPAGLLQPPFFGENADDAVIFGGLGALIGHELTHAFDNEHRLYDAYGNWGDWWPHDDSLQFAQKAGQLVEEYKKIAVIDTDHLDGYFTEAENLADLGGLNIAYEAFKKTEQGQSNDVIDGFTPDQRFFLSWAQTFANSVTIEDITLRLHTDQHSPGQVRCNIPPANMDAWYKAFDVQPSESLYLPVEKRVRVW